MEDPLVDIRDGRIEWMGRKKLNRVEKGKRGKEEKVSEKGMVKKVKKVAKWTNCPYGNYGEKDLYERCAAACEMLSLSAATNKLWR